MAAALVLHVAAEEQRQHLGRVDAAAVGLGEIAGAVKVDDAGDPAGRAGMIGSVEPLDVAGDAEKVRQVPAGGVAGDADAVGVDVILFRIDPQPTHRRLHVVDRRGKLVFGREAVIDRNGDIPALGELLAPVVPAVALSRAEAAAVNADHGGKARVRRDVLRSGEVELQVLLVGVDVLDAFFEDDVRRERESRHHQTDQDEDSGRETYSHISRSAH